MKQNFTFLSKQQIEGKNKLYVNMNLGVSVGLTDFTIALGAEHAENRHILINGKENILGCYWTRSKDDDCDLVYFLAETDTISGYIDSIEPDFRDFSARPIIENFNINDDFLKEKTIEYIYDIPIISYGEYPQVAASLELQKELQSAYQYDELTETGRTYTFDSVNPLDNNSFFKPKNLIEYMYKGHRYVKLEVVANDYDENVKLSNDIVYKNGDTVWIEVLPVRWYYDEQSKLLIAEKALFSGIRFDDKEKYDGNFENTFMYNFLNNIFAKDLVGEKLEVKEEKKNIIVTNGLDFSEVSEEDIIKGCVESDVSVFLHGKSSDGKSARVKQLDPNLEIIYLRNATPESLMGKSIYIPPVYKRVENPDTKIIEEVLIESGHMEDIPPTWYINLVNKCKNEPNKIHILFLDELTNALPSIQSMAYNIVLDKEVNGKWKLPKNVRIVAAGNELEDSLAANELVEPMFNRFAHTYIETHVKDFIKWATDTTTYESLDYEELSIPYKIHSIILAFISYKGDKVLRTKYNGKTPNADPRKWEMASRVLYKTKNPNMLRSLVGKELTNEFVHFCKTRVITIEDVLNGNYNEEELNEMDLGKKILTVNGMLNVDEEKFEVIYEFVKKLGSEATRLFETLWAKDNLERLELIQELHQEKLKKKVIR